MRGLIRRCRQLLVTVGVASVALVAAGLWAMNSLSSQGTAVAVGVTREQLLDRTRQLNAEVLRVDRIEAKRTTWADLQNAERSGDKVPGIAPGTSIIIVAVGGLYRTAFGHGQLYPWGVVVYDAATGRPIASFARADGIWPAFFDQIVDLGP
jgi:hypothetical protein